VTVGDWGGDLVGQLVGEQRRAQRSSVGREALLVCVEVVRTCNELPQIGWHPWLKPFLPPASKGSTTLVLVA